VRSLTGVVPNVRLFVRTLWPTVLGMALLPAMTNAAAAEPCGRPDLLETLPADGATDVPLNVRLSARYAVTAEYVNEEVTFEHVGFDTELPRVTFDSTEGRLSFEPSASLAAGDSYIVRWPALRGLTTAAAGKGAEVKFTAGSTNDVEPPLFGGVRAVTWDVERVDDDCTDSLEDRFIFDVSLDDAADDGGRGMLQLLIFQSKGGSATISPAPVLVQRFPNSGSRVRVQRAIDSAVGKVCFAALARDSSGRISSSADREVCTTTVKPPFFYGCMLSRASGGSRDYGRGAALVAILGLAAVSRQRARRGQRRG
jgi:Bacterial Ig-like domain